MGLWPIVPPGMQPALLLPKALIPQNSLAGTLVLGCHRGSRAQGHRLPFVQAKALLQGVRERGSSWKGTGHTEGVKQLPLSSGPLPSEDTKVPGGPGMQEPSLPREESKSLIQFC